MQGRAMIANDTGLIGYDTQLQAGDVVEVKRKTDEPVSRPGVSSEALLMSTPIGAGRAVE